MSIYYLGFQRAPPKQACVNGSICISPTILNDLREAVYSPQTDEVVRINIAWVIDEKELIKKLSVAATIVWQGVQTSYKQLQVSVPSRSAIYRLALWVETTSKLGRERSLSIRRLHHVMELEAFHSLQNQSTIFLPALSDAIKVSDAKDTQVNPSKSSHISRVFCTCQNRTFMIKEESGFELDKHLWDASLILTSCLEQQIQSRQDADILPFRQSESKSLRLVELGAGTGLVSIGLASLLARFDQDGEDEMRVHITATDLGTALELLQSNINENEANWKGKGITVDCRALDWLEDQTIPGADLLLVSDCTYNPTYFKPLCNAIETLLRQGKPTSSCLLAKKHRHVDEEALWSEMAAAGLSYTLLAGQHAVESGRWGIWKITLP